MLIEKHLQAIPRLREPLKTSIHLCEYGAIPVQISSIFQPIYEGMEFQYWTYIYCKYSVNPVLSLRGVVCRGNPTFLVILNLFQDLIEIASSFEAFLAMTWLTEDLQNF